MSTTLDKSAIALDDLIKIMDDGAAYPKESVLDDLNSQAVREFVDSRTTWLEWRPAP